MQPWHTQSMEQLYEELDSSPGGLSRKQARVRLEERGYNELPQGTKTPLFFRVLEQLGDPMILVLLAAAGVSAVTPC